MFYGEKKKIFLDNLVRSLREIVRYAEKRKIKVMLENVPVSNGIHDVVEFKYIIDNIASLFVHLVQKKKRGQINLEGKLAEIEYLAVGELVPV